MTPPVASAPVLDDVVERELAKFTNTIDLLHKGAIDPDKEFKPFRLVHGVYGQRQQGANQMVRIKLSYGQMNPTQMRVLAEASERFTNGISHITTRQAIQYHFIQLDDTPALMRMLEECGLTTREACGNAVRAVVGSPLAGTRADEPFNVQPYAEAVFRHFLRGPLSSSLPRKFKIGFSGSDADPLAQANIQDIGVTAVVVDGRQGFRIVAAGGLGSSPQAPLKLYDCLPKAELIPVCEALVRVHHKYGDRQNRAKARLKFVLRNKGDAGFRALFEEQLAAAKAEGIAGKALPDALPPANPTAIPVEGSPAERDWRAWNVHPHREAGLATVSVCIRRGDVPAREMRILADLCERYSAGDACTTNDQNIVFRRVKHADLSVLHGELAKLGYTRRAHGLVDVVSCPGASTCQLGITLSKNLGRELEEALRELGDDRRLNQSRVNISGCPNSCGQHHIGSIGLHGAASKIGDKLVPHYVLMVGGGDEGAKLHFASMVARIPARKVAATIKALAGWYLAERSGQESFAEYLRRQNGDGLDKDAAKAAKAKLKERLVPIFSYKEGEIGEQDLHDLGSDKLFSLDELGAGECMS
jgi:ferredoxin-nitrite reductase/sulfite reductase (ferredoxin)